MNDEAKRRKSYVKTLAYRALEAIVEVRNFAGSNAEASWMPDDEREYWDLVEIKAETIREYMDSLIKVIKA
ncbi:MAG: hypothetical protein ACWGQW_23650 [bacterium]